MMSSVSLGEFTFEFGLMATSSGVYLGISKCGAGNFAVPCLPHELHFYFPTLGSAELNRLADFLSDQLAPGREGRWGTYSPAFCAEDGENDAYRSQEEDK
jgi:hypothetical protein